MEITDTSVIFHFHVINASCAKLKVASRQLDLLEARVMDALRRYCKAKVQGHPIFISSLRRKLAVLVGVRKMYRKYARRLASHIGNHLEDLVLVFSLVGVTARHENFVDRDSYVNIYRRIYHDEYHGFSSDSDLSDSDSEPVDDDAEQMDMTDAEEVEMDTSGSSIVHVYV
ncbi:hypothetical protein DPMN_065787 [Dreissena polymorpha]|uniref:Uncharacterized protein n=1 Tax=Dreissena polymorpha TaxID=45954 RepID=A0A9D3YWJ1_DREPO|nr:hypothetical protein DPMN_065787 [Dreissena polymorpha]